MVDVFGEVDEQLRSQRYEDLIRRAWPFAAAAAGVVVIAAIGIWGWNRHEAQEEAKASVAYQAAFDTEAKGDFATANRDFQALAASAPAGYRALSLMQEAQIALDHRTADEAVKLLDQAAKVAPDAIVGDAARLKAALVLLDRRPLPEVQDRLKPLEGAKSPYRALALEASAMAKLLAGQTSDAKSAFEVLTLSQDVSQSTQNRARAALALIASGTAGALPAAVKSAAAVPPEKAALYAKMAAALPGLGGAQ